MSFTSISCSHCSGPIICEHSTTFLFSCDSCGTPNALDTSIDIKQISGRKIQSPSVLAGKRSVSINGTYYQVRGTILLYTTRSTCIVHVLLSNLGELFYLFESLGSFYLGADQPFEPDLKKTSAGSEIIHNTISYKIAEVERVDNAIVNGEVKFPLKQLVRTYLLFTFEKEKNQLVVMVHDKEKKGLLLKTVDHRQIL